MLDAVERESTWLRDKAFRRVWHATTIGYTEAMRRTPRNLLAARAREGNWSSFPVSPGRYFARLDAIYRGGGYYDFDAVRLVTLLLDREGDKMASMALNDDERLAIRRGC